MTLTFLAPIKRALPNRTAMRSRLPMPSADLPGLSERDRAILTMAGRMTFTAVAAELGITKSIVCGVVYRARGPRPRAGGTTTRASLYFDSVGA